MVLGEEELLKNGVLRVAELMAVAAKTAPKAKGIDNIEVRVLAEKEELEKLARKMEEMAEELGEFFKRDAQNIRDSHAVVLVGAKRVRMNLKTPPDYTLDIDTVMELINLGIALGSAAKTASIHNVDNRIMYSAGLAAQRMKLIDAEYVMAIPLSAQAKNIYFDRK